MMNGMHKKLDEVLQESVRNGQSISELDLCRVDKNIVIAFQSNDMLEIVIKKKEPDIRKIQLSKLMTEPFPRLTHVTLQ
jgi:predicted transcriptional regulator